MSSTGAAARAALAAIVETSQDAIIGKTLEGQVRSWNRGAEQIYGYRADEVLGRSIDLLFPEEREEEERRIFDRLRRGERVPPYETQRRAKDGRLVDVSVAVSPLIDESGKIIGASAIARDIGERKRLEAELREGRERFRQVTESIREIFWLADAASGEILYISPAFSHLYGLPAEAVYRDRSTLLEGVHPEDHERLREALARPADEGVEMEYRLLPEDAPARWIWVRRFPVRAADGTVVRTAGIAEDVTARKLAELELSRSNAELERFAFVASHDLQEPLRMVTSYVRLLEKRYADRLDDDAREFIAFAVDGAVRMRRLIEDLLAYSRVSSRGRRLVPTDSDGALDEALDNLRVAVEETGAEIVRGPLPQVAADRFQLVQLFQNLVGNALKFRRRDRPPAVEVSAHRQGRLWVFAVRDDGIGVDPRYHERIFQVFQHLHSVAEYPGTGIGLALCQRIVERHGGRIWVESEEGRGATFFFILRGTGEGGG